MSSKDGLDDLVHKLLKDLEIDSFAHEEKSNLDLKSEFYELLSSKNTEKSVFFDASLMSASLGRWDLALEYCQNFMSSEVPSPSINCWKLRCLVELEKYSEALALASSNEWPQELKIHVKYLSGICYFNLNMKDHSRANFDYVKRQDSGYRDVAGWLLKV